MPTEALLLVLSAALLHAIWNLAAKRAGGDYRFTFLVGLLVAVLWSPAALWLGWSALPTWGIAQWSAIFGSAVLHLGYFVVLLRGYRAADLTVVYPVARGSAPLVTALAALLLLNEQLSTLAATGVLAVCGGILLLAGGTQFFRGSSNPKRLQAGLRWGICTGLLIAGYSVLDGFAVKKLGIHPLMMDYFGNALRVPLLLPFVWPKRATLATTLAPQWKAALMVATLGSLGYILVLQAVTLAPLSHVAPAREVSMVLAALLGGKLLGEEDRGLRLLGAAVMTTGVILLAIG